MGQGRRLRGGARWQDCRYSIEIQKMQYCFREVKFHTWHSSKQAIIMSLASCLICYNTMVLPVILQNHPNLVLLGIHRLRQLIPLLFGALMLNMAILRQGRRRATGVEGADTLGSGFLTSVVDGLRRDLLILELVLNALSIGPSWVGEREREREEEEGFLAGRTLLSLMMFLILSMMFECCERS